LEEQQKEGNTMRLAGIDTASMNVQLESDEVLSSLFACKLELANQKFELKINDIRFVSHPALMETKNSFILINIVFALQAQCSYSIGNIDLFYVLVFVVTFHKSNCPTSLPLFLSLTEY